MTDLRKLVAEKFKSSNSIEVERITISRKEYEAALAQPEQEPVAWINAKESFCGFPKLVISKKYKKGFSPVYTAPPSKEKSELEKDAANLLFALHDAWPYVHGHCTIESIKKSITKLMRKHGDFADLHRTTKCDWVGLHLDDIPEIYLGDKSFLYGAKWAEVKLKEKNTVPTTQVGNTQEWHLKNQRR